MTRLPRPASLAPENLDRLLALVRRHYPDWDGFHHPKFHKDEIGYKQQAIRKAAETLSEQELQRLLDAGRSGEIVARIRSLAGATNLLYLSTPTTGDLALLYAERFTPAAFIEALIDLLHGWGDSPERLERFVAWARMRGLPVRWPLPTYLLFLTHPDRDYFVKPRVTRWFLEFMGEQGVYIPNPRPDIYAAILDVVRALRNGLATFRPRDMVDVQSLIWVAHSSAKDPDPIPVVDRQGRKNTVDPVIVDPVIVNPEYTLVECAQETGFDAKVLQRWVSAIHRKGQAILYGPPGTGKTHLARHLSRHLVGGNQGLEELVQFHPSYSYEEFIQGIRPQARPDGGLDYPLKKGRFLEFCERASELEEEDTCVLIIDEINRANLSRVFGELMYLLEYREQDIPLAGGGRFRIPDNVRILGTMNTADRSIALVDHALRRRFAFIGLRPDFGILRRFHHGNGFPVERLVSLLQRLNADIRDPHYEVGITFFLRRDLANEIEDIWCMEIVPYLEEYFFDQPGKVDAYRWEQVQRDLKA
ncbi:MAG TPA: AAA family ATPase [Thermoanaerobaculia bacterium]|nr:AAA family ATPase [Thermoanaerobaculia bacterium]